MCLTVEGTLEVQRENGSCVNTIYRFKSIIYTYAICFQTNNNEEHIMYIIIYKGFCIHIFAECLLLAWWPWCLWPMVLVGVCHPPC